MSISPNLVCIPNLDDGHEILEGRVLESIANTIIYRQDYFQSIDGT